MYCTAGGEGGTHFNYLSGLLNFNTYNSDFVDYIWYYQSESSLNRNLILHTNMNIPQLFVPPRPHIS